VRAMFDRIAGVYDAMNTAMTAGLHHHWRARAADLADVGPGGRVLDVATGTGDMAIELAQRVSPGARSFTLQIASLAPATLTVAGTHALIGRTPRSVRIPIAPGRGALVLEIALRSGRFATVVPVRVTR